MFGKRLLALVFCVEATAQAGMVSFEGDVLPEDLGFERAGTSDADRWIDNGWFCQHVALGDWAPPPGGQQDFYQRSLAEFAGAPFVIEWRVITDAPGTEIDGVGGSSLVVAGGPVMYHFTIAEDQVRLVRGVQFENLWIDIEPCVPHTYRLEIDRGVDFRWFIDGELIISDIPEGDFPNAAGVLSWGAS